MRKLLRRHPLILSGSGLLASWLLSLGLLAGAHAAETEAKAPWWSWWTWANGVLGLSVGGVSYGPADRAIVGTDRLVAEPRYLGHFHAVSVRGPVDLVIKQGETETVFIHTDDNIAPLIQTTVDANGVLQIQVAPGVAFRTKHSVGVSVNSKFLDTIQANGSGDVLSGQIEADELHVDVTGTGKIHLAGLHLARLDVSAAASPDILLSGTVQQTRLHLSGHATLDAAELVTRVANVTLDQAAQAKIWVNQTLDAHLSAQAKLNYRGAASVKSTVEDTASLTHS